MPESERLSSGFSGRRVAAVVMLSAVGVLVAAGVAILWLGGAGHGAAGVTAVAGGRASLQPGARQRTGRLRCWRSRSTSVIAFPTLQTDSHTLTLTESLLHLTIKPAYTVNRTPSDSAAST